MQSITLNGRIIGSGHAPYVVAELSANHNGSLDQALQLVAAAKNAGADAVKLQTYRPDTITMDCDSEEFQILEGPWKGMSLYELYTWAHTPWEWHAPLFTKAQEVGIDIFSSPFDFSAVDLLEKMNTPAYKVASLELVDLPLIRYIAQTGKPMILSAGAADLEEIQEAMTAAHDAGCRELILMQCVSSYPAPPSDYNLKTLPDMERRFSVPVGLSDHTLSNTTAIAAVALGACMIEKHFTMSRKSEGPDNSFSLDPDGLKDLCWNVRTAWDALGKVDYSLPESAREAAKHRRSLYVVEKVHAGETFTEKNVRSIRPSLGLLPKYLPDVLGKAACRDIQRGTPLQPDMVKGFNGPSV